MRATLFVAGLLAALAGPGAAEAPCRLALVLGLDVSSSVNAREYRIQLGGLVRAFRTAEVQRAILSPAGTSIAILAFEWSGADHQRLIVPWTRLADRTGIEAFADRLAGHRRTADDGSTAVGEALKFAARSFAAAPPCGARTGDLSGDGETNEGPHPEVYRAAGLFDGLTINGLAVQGAYPNPGLYYRRQVMQGPDAFVALARDFDDYPSVIVGKLLRELDVGLVVGHAKAGR